MVSNDVLAFCFLAKELQAAAPIIGLWTVYDEWAHKFPIASLLMDMMNALNLENLISACLCGY